MFNSNIILIKPPNKILSNNYFQLLYNHGGSQVPSTAIIVHSCSLPELVLPVSSSHHAGLHITALPAAPLTADRHAVTTGHSSPESSRITATSESSESILSQTHHVNCASIIIRADVYISSILNSCIVHVGVTDDVQILATVSLAGLFLLLRSYSSRFPQSRWRP